ncbi:transcription-repair coupling factor [Candidatus Enterovibrio escicola]|uniref:transcription-repair coupling factor n=1 Tax=Candidatus Enterovibrio escicola TaxID=1927127 RepID=UPI0012383A05|nr:transcription-repair coupling factor [Candidatus Enterovibrio escacola]
MKNIFFSEFTIPYKAGDTRIIGNLQGSALPLAIAQIADQQHKRILLVVPDNQTALKLQPEVKQFTGRKCHVFPDWETLPYDNFSPHQDIISDRIACLYQLPQQISNIIIIPVSTLLQRIMPRSFLIKHALIVKKGDHISLEKIRYQLELSGYRHVNQVIEHGEYACRGSILDLFPMGSNQPYRIDFFDEDVDSIREFDPENQCSTQKLDQINLLPAHEFPTDDDAVERFRGRWRERFDLGHDPESIYQQVSKKMWPAGIEYWQPLFFDETETLFDYLPNSTLLLTSGDLETAACHFLNDAEYRFNQHRVDPLRPLLKPNELWQSIEELFTAFKAYPRIKLEQDSTETKAGRQNAPVKALPKLTVNHQLKEPLDALKEFITHFSGKVIFSVETEGRREAIFNLLSKIKIHTMVCNSLDEALRSPSKFSLIIGPAEFGFISEQPRFALICESNLLGTRVIRQRQRSNKKAWVISNTLIRNLAELQQGQPVVHLEHGVGRYLGLQTLETGGIETEYVILEYRHDSKLYVPVSSLHLISRYSCGTGETAPFHRLGGEVWDKIRKKAVKKVRDVAAELLDVYAKRETKLGFAFKHDHKEYLDFCSGFPFEETIDQAQAINAVLSDMCRPIAMDRLICGDVGFGKTEVAMRATFLAVNNIKQVAILVPTTLLAQQHFENFRDRFANHPVRVEVLSRFKSTKEQKQILADSSEGKIDILIGTHKLLQSYVHFQDLGLLIVDEEHRFGVRQKEKVKAMRSDVDILTLTATPIPRTLNMAMSGIRDLSIIATPPSRRLAIKTFMRERDISLIREAMLREIMRGGQVYFLHNDIDSIERTANELAVLVPEARVTVAHGQMRERELERIMSDFYHQRFNVLVCTTIIETGIDVPTANTIIMDRADHFGLAQLHQLRGRVGRSHHQAYAYMLTPHPKLMTKDAIKRLEAISSLEDLGAGFALATHDMEIRGVGELLGEDQSGQIQSIGFTLYMEMLEQAVEALKEGKEPSLYEQLNQQTDVELRLPTLLPDMYIPDVNTRLSIYKRISVAKSKDEIEEMRVELVDRFGLLPKAAKDLLKVQQIKLAAAKLGIKKIDAHDKGCMIEFKQNTQINPHFLIGLLQSHPNRYYFDGSSKLKIVEALTDRGERVKFIEILLTQFADNLFVA